MARILFISVMLTGAFMAGFLHASEGAQPKGVVELFTSQGCSSCPPADAALQKLVEQGDVVALSYHVDYWNYLGWADTLSSKENTERQYAYARTLGRSNVYTPQAVINGRDHMNGADLQAINAKLDTFKAIGGGLSVDVQADMQGDQLEINIGPGSGKANVVIAYFQPQQMVTVEKGENSGKRITYWNNVTKIETVGIWEGKAVHLALPATVIGSAKKGGCAILLQSAGPGGEPAAILGAKIVLADKER